jgi:tetratricopeptide (TPR) repeat protein
VSAAENRVLWAETYDRAGGDVFAVQQEIAAGWSGAAGDALAGRERGLGPPGTGDPIAYEHFLKGQFFRRQQTAEALDRAIAYFDHAIARDSGYARAHAGLADALALRVLFATARRARSTRVPCARRRGPPRSIRRSPTRTRRSAPGLHLPVGLGDGRPELQQALALDSTLTSARLWRGIALLHRRRFDEAAAVLERALAADPLAAPVRMTLGRVHLARGDRRARSCSSRAPSSSTRDSRTRTSNSGTPTCATGARRRRARRSRGPPRWAGRRLRTAGVRLRRDRSPHGGARDLRALLASAERRYLPPFGVAMAYAGLGDADAAFRWLDRAVDERAAFMDGLAVAPGFVSLHGDPRWSPLLRRVLPPE